jgi:hypothetical protein
MLSGLTFRSMCSIRRNRPLMRKLCIDLLVFGLQPAIRTEQMMLVSV